MWGSKGRRTVSVGVWVSECGGREKCEVCKGRRTVSVGVQGKKCEGEGEGVGGRRTVSVGVQEEGEV